MMIIKKFVTLLLILCALNSYAQEPASPENYCTRVPLFNDMELNFFTPKMFRIRTSSLEGEKFPAKYMIPFAIGKLDSWDAVTYKMQEDDQYKYIFTGDIGIKVDKSNRSWTVWTHDFKTRIHPSDKPARGLFKNGYTLFDAASAFNEINNNSRYAHWFYNAKTGNYIDTYLPEDKLLDQYFIYGPDYPSLFAQFNQLVGPEPLLPKKAYGFFQTQHLACEGTQAQLMEAAKQFRARGIPVDNLIIDFEWGDGCDKFEEVTWGSRLDWSENYRQPVSPKKMIQALNAMHYDVMLIRHNAPNFKNRTGQGWTETVSDERTWWREYFERMEEGVAGTWQDTRQNDVTDSYIWQKTQEHIGPEKRVLFLGCRKMQSVNPWDFRFSTVPVNQVIGARRYPFDWTGDASFSWNEFKWQIEAITDTHGAMKGITYLTSDAVGANWKIQARWNQFADFSTISRSHNPKPWTGTIDTKNFENKIRITGRDTIQIKQESITGGNKKTAEESITRHRKLRYRLLPYIYSYAIENYLTGLPITRPMLLAFPDDYLCNANNWPYQYMFGNELLVAPVYGDFNSMEIYLPRGFNWIDYWSREVYPDGGLIRYNTSDINKLPLFVKAGAILPMRQEMNWIDPTVRDTLTFEIYPSDTVSSLTFYEDDNLSTRYQKGAYGITNISYDGRNLNAPGISISKTKGDFVGKQKTGTMTIKVNLIPKSPKTIRVNNVALTNRHHDKSHGSNGWFYDTGKQSIVLNIERNTDTDTEILILF